MFKIYVINIFLAFLASETYSLGIPDSQNVLSKFQTSEALVTKFSNIGYSITPGQFIQKIALSPYTCSIKVYYDKFSFNQPSKDNDTSAYNCVSQKDKLDMRIVDGFVVPPSCGELTGQTIYVPVKDYDDTTLDSVAAKSFILEANYLGTNGLLSEKPTWYLTVTQIPCCGKNEVKQLQDDSLPPSGCFQYHTEKEGIVESYNYNNGKGHYIGQFDYTICFKRYPDTCGIKFSAIGFELPTNGGNTSTERDCDTPNPNADKKLYKVTNRDNLLIQNGVSTINGSEVFASKYCGNSLMNREVIVKTQGPISMKVITDSVSGPLDNERGFKINYKLLTEC